jgi:trans-aconitate 2-methyltransferase
VTDHDGSVDATREVAPIGEPREEGGDPACWAHLFENDDTEAALRAARRPSPVNSRGAGDVGRRESGVSTYTYGDDAAALRRLALVAQAYEPVSAAFLAEQASRHRSPDTVLDVGCGPGHTTALLARLLTPRRLIGIDSSGPYLEVARSRVPGARFLRHDATVTPLPGAPVDVIYARLVLAHLPDPLGTLDRWRSGLGSGGVLLVEDLEDIDAPSGALRTYDELAAEVVRRGGGVMYAGAAMAELGGRRVSVTVPAATAAAIYLFNVERWIDDRTQHPPHDQLLDLRRDLDQLARQDGGQTVSWIVRQLALAA